MFASQNVGCFFRLFLGKERAATGDLVVATTKNHLAKTAAHEKIYFTRHFPDREFPLDMTPIFLPSTI